MNNYDRGDLIRCSGVFTDAAGSAQDPDVVIFKFTDPSGTTTTYTYNAEAELVKDSVGNYHVDVNADATGLWRTRWEATGTGQAADESAFRVAESQFD